MAVAFVTFIGLGQGPVNTITINRPACPVSGNMLIAFVTRGGNCADITSVCSEFTEMVDATDAHLQHRAQGWWRVIACPICCEPTNYQWTHGSGNTIWAAHIWQLSGAASCPPPTQTLQRCETATSFDFAAAPTADNSGDHMVFAIAVTVGGEDIVCCITAPCGYTFHGYVDTGNGAGHSSVPGFYKILSDATDENPGAASYGRSDLRIGATFLVQDASAGGAEQVAQANPPGSGFFLDIV